VRRQAERRRERARRRSATLLLPLSLWEGERE
jgi:hypothetical protein